jgi:hypothetical protein
MHPVYKLEYLTDPRPLCPRCGEPKHGVKERPDPFVVEGICAGPEMISCEACYDERRMDV